MVIEPEAEADLAEAYRWDENQRSGLGDEFIARVDAALDRVCEAPEVHAAVYKNVRQALVRRFPYVVCYVFEEPSVSVVAVFHGHRDPAIWSARVRAAESRRRAR